MNGVTRYVSIKHLPTAQAGGSKLTPDEAKQIAVDAYIYGYSLITTDVTRVQMSNVAKVEEIKAPTGTFFNIKRYPPATFRGVSATNADTLYTVRIPDVRSCCIGQGISLL